MGTYSEERGEHRELLADITVEDPAPLVMVEPLWSAVREAVVQSGASIVDENAYISSTPTVLQVYCSYPSHM
ncbi:MAG: hypothetical protein M1396_04500 [Chloroflexi bacterium]|nr:hypothetical protein [Chloroflexota bacterium]